MILNTLIERVVKYNEEKMLSVWVDTWQFRHGSATSNASTFDTQQGI